MPRSLPALEASYHDVLGPFFCPRPLQIPAIRKCRSDSRGVAAANYAGLTQSCERLFQSVCAMKNSCANSSDNGFYFITSVEKAAQTHNEVFSGRGGLSDHCRSSGCVSTVKLVSCSDWRRGPQPPSGLSIRTLTSINISAWILYRSGLV